MTTNSKGHGQWTDLGQEHIVRAASIYSNIPLSKKKELSVVLKKAADKTLANFSAPTK